MQSEQGVTGGADSLFKIDINTSVGTLISSVGRTGIQALAFSPKGTLYGWDLSSGLSTINPLTGEATDVNPFVGDLTQGIQGLAFAPNTTLYGVGGVIDLIPIDRDDVATQHQLRLNALTLDPAGFFRWYTLSPRR